MTTAESLFEILDNESPETIRYQLANYLTQAMNDWPVKVESLEDYILQLKKMVRSEKLNIKILDEALKQLKPECDAWIIESLTNLKYAFEISGYDDVDSITKRIFSK